MAIANLDELHQFEQFLFHEAAVMDDHRYDEWLDLWVRDDARYWLPCNHEDVDPASQVSLVYEDFNGIEERILRLKSKFAHTQSPKARLLRVVSNVFLESVTENEMVGTSTFSLGSVRIDHEASWFGRSRHQLVRVDGQWKIKHKKVFMLNNDAPMSNMTFLV